jgi:2,5-furandicarboxylate decarboxylase 1
MNLREFIASLESKNLLIRINEETNPRFGMTDVLMKNQGKAVLFEKVRGTDTKVIGNLYSSRELISLNLGIKPEELMFRMAEAIESPEKCDEIPASKAPCMEVEAEPDLSKIPIPTYYPLDGGAYLSSAVIITHDPEHGVNMSTHRMMFYGEGTKLVARICHRDLWKFLELANGRGEDLQIAICNGNEAQISLASATHVGPGFNELEMANVLKPVRITTTKSGIPVPADCELVMEGRITSERHGEGPFVDITGTYDTPERQEPVIVIDSIHHRKDYIFQALLPGENEHRLLMGLPREPTIYQEVNKVCSCKNISLTPGGCGWLHAVVQIDKKGAEDGKKAIEATFKGHPSLKHCVIVDTDIDIYNPHEVEWAICTRVQADEDFVIFKGPGSSLDVTAKQIPGSDRKETAKLGVDATIPYGRDKKDFLKAKELESLMGAKRSGCICKD